MSQVGRTRYFAPHLALCAHVVLRAKYRIHPAWLIKRLSCRLVSDGESRLAKFTLLFGSAKKNMDILQLMPQIKSFKIYCLNSECFSTVSKC